MGKMYSGEKVRSFSRDVWRTNSQIAGAGEGLACLQKWGDKGKETELCV